MNLLLLYVEFIKIGFFSIGGGLATLPFLFTIAARDLWLKPHDISNFLAIAQCTPGAIGINTSAQTGFLAAGLAGAIVTPLALITGPVIIILIIARFLAAFRESNAVKAIFSGIRPAAAGLISAAGFSVIALSLYNKLPDSAWYQGLRLKETVLFAVTFVLIFKFNKHPIVYIAAAALAGMLLGL